MVFGAPSDAKGARAWADPCSQEPQATHGVQALSQGPGPLGLQGAPGLNNPSGEILGFNSYLKSCLRLGLKFTLHMTIWGAP